MVRESNARNSAEPSTLLVYCFLKECFILNTTTNSIGYSIKYDEYLTHKGIGGAKILT
jgi:hypothetical protein